MRVYDLVPFYNEVELLRLRVELLADCGYEVTHVVAEANRTHQGEPKPYLLETEDLPDNVERVEVDLSWLDGAWTRERCQRDTLATALRSADPEDLVLSCDVDELVDPRRLEDVVRATDSGPVKLAMRLYYYGLDWMDPRPWAHPVALRVGELPGRTLSEYRTDVPLSRIVGAAGWHVSYWGGTDRRRQKIEAFAHAEVREDANMLRRVEAGGAADPHGNRLLPARLDGVHPLVLERLR